MHNQAFQYPPDLSVQTAPLPWAPRRSRRRPTSETRIRLASVADVAPIVELVNGFADEGLMLHRSADDVLRTLSNYVVAHSAAGRVLACAALTEYSPSLAEVSSVAVHSLAHGQGLGSRVVTAVERVARQRDITELFAMSLSERFFLGLGYDRTEVARYPEKLARYDALRAAGHAVVDKGCFRKVISP